MNDKEMNDKEMNDKEMNDKEMNDRAMNDKLAEASERCFGVRPSGFARLSAKEKVVHRRNRQLYDERDLGTAERDVSFVEAIEAVLNATKGRLASQKTEPADETVDPVFR